MQITLYLILIPIKTDYSCHNIIKNYRAGKIQTKGKDQYINFSTK